MWVPIHSAEPSSSVSGAVKEQEVFQILDVQILFHAEGLEKTLLRNSFY